MKKQAAKMQPDETELKADHIEFNVLDREPGIK